jgi:hypothetical protein
MLTHQALLEVIDYDPTTGIFSRKPRPNSRYVRKRTTVGHSRSDGYIDLCVLGRRYLAHRLAWFYMTGEWPEIEVDHKDLRRDNNIWTNLRLANHSQNSSNCERRKTRKIDSGYKGVYWIEHAGKWRVNITVNKKQYYLGYFSDPKEAYAAYCAASKKYHGEFSRV